MKMKIMVVNRNTLKASYWIYKVERWQDAVRLAQHDIDTKEEKRKFYIAFDKYNTAFCKCIN